MIREFLRKQGYHPAPALVEMPGWLSWYKGDVEGFHDYTMYNGKKIVKRKRDGMNMAKQVCQDWASLLMNEKVKIESSEAKFNKILDDVLTYNAFYFRANQLIELTFALGTGAFVEYMDADGRTIIDYVRGDCIYPLSWDNGEITECAFASLRQIGGKECFYVNLHIFDGGTTYTVKNFLLDKESKKPMALPENVLEKVQTNSDRPRFQIIQPNIVNNVDLDSPYGISVFANSIPRLKKVDLIFDSGNNEFSLGKKRIIVPENMTTAAIGESLDKPIFDPNDVAFYAFPVHDPAGSAQKPIDLTGQLRIQEHSTGLQDALNYLSEGVGLGPGRYEYRDGGAKTATEVVSEDSDMFRNLKRHEIVLEKALRDLCTVIAEMNGHNPDVEVAINFDDSIITDRAQDIEENIKLTSAGLKSKLSALMDLNDWDETTAKKELARIQEEHSAPISEQQDFFGNE